MTSDHSLNDINAVGSEFFGLAGNLLAKAYSGFSALCGKMPGNIIQNTKTISFFVVVISFTWSLLDGRVRTILKDILASTDYDTIITFCLLGFLALLLAGCCFWLCCFADDLTDISVNMGSGYGISYSRSGNVEGNAPEPGATGLQNMGNTCYLNSTIQCLSAIPELTEYFVSGAYQEHVNENNSFGSGGEIAHAYADLLKDVWSGNFLSVYPRKFHSVVVRHLPRFVLGEQQDFQEFLVALLDKLHEDLNQGSAVLTSPTASRYNMTDTREADLVATPAGVKGLNGDTSHFPSIDDIISPSNGSVHGIPSSQPTAKRAWREYVERNRSIIADKFQGQQVCETACTNVTASGPCGYVAKKYETLMYLSLPIPTTNRLWSIECLSSVKLQAMHQFEDVVEASDMDGEGDSAYRVDFEKMPLFCSYDVAIPSSSTIDVLHATLLDAICEHFMACGALSRRPMSLHTLPFELILMERVGTTLRSVLGGKTALRNFQSSYIIAYLIPKVPPSVRHTFMPVYQRHRYWTMDRTHQIAHPNSAPKVETIDDEAMELYFHPVSSVDDCYDLPATPPDYFHHVVTPSSAVPLVLVVCEGDTFEHINKLVMRFAAEVWAYRDASGVGVRPVETYAAPPLSSYTPSLVWVDTFAPQSCGLGGVTGCRSYTCRGCPFSEIAKHLTHQGTSAADDGDGDGGACNMTTVPANLLSNMPAIAVQWFRPEDYPKHADHLGLNDLWDRYNVAWEHRNAALQEYHREPNATLPTTLADPMGHMPTATMAKQVRGMTFTPQKTIVQHRSAASVSKSMLNARGDVDISIDSCLTIYSAETQLSEGNLYLCSKCKCRVPARQHTMLTRVPEILIIVLKRFVLIDDYGSTDKVDTRVQFPLVGLDLSRWIHNDDANPQTTSPTAEDAVYDLFATCHHSGSLTAGHYTAYVQHPRSGIWYNYNDVSVYPVSDTPAHDMTAEARESLERVLVTPSAYVLMYRRRPKQ